MTKEAHRHDKRDPECLRVFEALSEYLDGELTPADCQGIEAHIAGCDPCVDFLESLKRGIQASKQFTIPEPPPSMPVELREKLLQAWREALARRSAQAE